MKNINERVARHITRFVATMYCAYFFAALAMISLPAALASRNVLVITGWIAQTFLQLVLLSVIMVGQDIESRKAQEKLDQILELILKKEDQILAVEREELLELQEDENTTANQELPSTGADL